MVLPVAYPIVHFDSYLRFYCTRLEIICSRRDSSNFSKRASNIHQVQDEYNGRLQSVLFLTNDGGGEEEAD